MVSPIVTNTDVSLHQKRLVTFDDITFRVNVKSFPYLATGDGVTDDTAAIRAAIAGLPSSNGLIFFPAGTYIVNGDAGVVDTQLGAILPFTTINTKVQGEGAASIIKVKNNANQYTTIIGGANFSATDLSGFEVCDLTFDHNINNNNITNYAAFNFQHTVRVGIGTNIRIHHCRIMNSSSVNNITINGATISGVWIENNYFVNNGDDPAHVDHDVSVIYTHASNVNIRGNFLSSTGKDDGGATTGIETHGSDTNVSENIVINYRTGMNITGVEEVDTVNVLVQGNIVSGGNLGINLWSFNYLLHTSGLGIYGWRVESNQVYLDPISEWATKNPAGYTQGIAINPNGAGQLDITGLSICNNTIQMALESADINSNSVSLGIGFYSSTNKTISNSEIRGNRIVNFPLAGIRLSCNVIDVDVSENILINCGCTRDTAVAGTLAYRIPIMIAAPNCHGLRIANNKFYDDIAELTFRPAYFIALTQQITVAASHVNIVDNTFESRGSAMTAAFQIDNSGALLIPYFKGTIPGFAATGLGGANQKFAKGSQITNSTDGTIYTIANDQITWTAGLLSTGLMAGTRRLKTYGTALTNGDFAIGAGWGTTAALVVTGTDTAFVAHITAGGAGLAANAALVLTWKDGSWPVVPVSIGHLANSNHAAMMAEPPFITCNTATLTITTSAAVAPNPAGTYEFHVFVIGKS